MTLTLGSLAPGRERGVGVARGSCTMPCCRRTTSRSAAAVPCRSQHTQTRARTHIPYGCSMSRAPNAASSWESGGSCYQKYAHRRRCTTCLHGGVPAARARAARARPAPPPPTSPPCSPARCRSCTRTRGDARHTDAATARPVRSVQAQALASRSGCSGLRMHVGVCTKKTQVCGVHVDTRKLASCIVSGQGFRLDCVC